MEQYHCADCGRELFDFGDGQPPTRCEDCIPETGPGSRLVDQQGANLRRLRLRAGMEKRELARRAALRVEELSRFEDGAHELGIAKALRLAHSMSATIDELVERIYWNPGETAHRPSERRPPSERLAGFFLMLPANVPVFDPPPPRDPVDGRLEAAAILGQSVRAARERRHLTQAKLARAAGLSKAGLSLIERGVRETTIATLLSLARALEVTPELLLGGVVWKPRPSACAPVARRGGAQRHDARSLDGPIRQLWSEGKTAGEIASEVGTSPGAVSAIVHRLREHGDPLAYRSPPTRSVHEGARLRRCRRFVITLPEDRCVGGESAADASKPQASDGEMAARIGANVALHRQAASLTLRELGEAIEVDRTHLHRIENGRAGLPRLSLVVKLAAGLNVRCARVTAGIAWDPGAGKFMLEVENDSETAMKRLGGGIRRARRMMNVSQQALGARAAMSRGDVVDFERGSRNFQIFAAVRLAGALGVDLAQVFSGVESWYVRPLPAPEYGHEDCPPTKAERDALLGRLWREGRSEREIADALGLKLGSIGSYVRELRDAGQRLPYRRPPRCEVENAARRRRNAERLAPLLSPQFRRRASSRSRALADERLHGESVSKLA